MKKTLLIFLTAGMLLLLLPACQSERSFVLELPSNPTTGYTWTCQIENPAVVSLEKDEFIASDSNKMGAGGTQRYVFKAGQNGTTTVTLQYLRSWEPNSVTEERVYEIEAENGKIVRTSEISGTEDLSIAE